MLLLRNLWPRSLLAAAALLAVAALLAALTGDRAEAQRRPTPVYDAASKERINQNTVGIAAGKSDSAFLAAVEDLTNVLDDGDTLRVLAVLGKGAAQNVRDTLFLRNMDMGITQANILSYFKKTGELGANVEARLVYITKLFNEEVHIVAGPGIDDLRALAGKTVNVGEAGSGTELTAKLIFESLKIDVKTVSMAWPDALAAIRRGDIAASVLLTGKPFGGLAKVRSQGGGELKLLSIPFEESLEQDYLPARFTHEDYPDLIAEGDTIETVAVPAVLAAYNWAPGTDRHRRLKIFVEAFFSKFPELRKEPRHPKWREVNLLADVPGWQRFPPAKQWLDANSAPKAAQPAANAATAAAQKKSFEQFLANQRKAGAQGLPANPAAQQAMFQKFLEWMDAQNAGKSADAPATAAPQTGGSQAAPGSSPRLW